MQPTQRNIVWLASYPKSGNTWFRMFLSALDNNGSVDINNMAYQMNFASRSIFQRISGINSVYLYDEEAKELQAEVYRKLAVESTEKLFIKIHDNFQKEGSTQPVVPQEASLCAIYFIRNPLDIAASLANHLNKPIQNAVSLLCDNNACFAPQHNNLNTSRQFRQYLSDWSTHVQSWAKGPGFPVYMVRYEDILENPFAVFKELLFLIGKTDIDDKAIRTAIEATSFDKLKKQEEEKGFNEKFSVETPNFFRSGIINNWINELTDAEADAIINCHTETMKQFGYIT